MMWHWPRFHHGTGERGAALLLTFLMMLVLAGLAMATAIHAQNSIVSGNTHLLDKQAYYIAQAGWARARRRFAPTTRG